MTPTDSRSSGTIRQSLMYSVASTYVAAAISFVSTLVLARLLTPVEIGVFAATSAVAAMAHTVRDMGVGEYVVQARQLDEEILRAAFTVTLVLSWALGAAIYFSSGYIARFYQHDGAGEVARILAFNFLLVPFGAINMACFQRQLNFAPMFLITVVGMPVAVATSILLALHGYGYMSLAWSSLAYTAVTVVVSVSMRWRETLWLPAFAGCADMLRFGKHILFISFANQAAKSAPDIIVGRVLGMAPAGYFTRAGGLPEIVNRVVMRAISPVCLPYFSSHVQTTGDVRAGYSKALALVTAVAWPFYGFLAIAAYPVVRVLYGDQWDAAVPLARLLCIAAAVDATYFYTEQVLVSAGHVAKNSRLVLVMQLLRCLLVLAAAPLGLVPVACAMLAGALVSAFLSHRVLNRTTGLSFTDLRQSLATNLAITGAALAAPALMVHYAQSTHISHVVLIAGSGLAALASWLLALCAFGHPLWHEVVRLRDKASRRPVLGERAPPA